MTAALSSELTMYAGFRTPQPIHSTPRSPVSTDAPPQYRLKQLARRAGDIFDRITGIADAIAILIGLIAVRVHRAVIHGIGHAIAIQVRVAGITDTVEVLVFLV